MTRNQQIQLENIRINRKYKIFDDNENIYSDIYI